MFSPEQAKRLGIKKTINLKEMILNDEGYFKLNKKTDIFLIGLYIFAIVGFGHTILWYFNFLNK